MMRLDRRSLILAALGSFVFGAAASAENALVGKVTTLLKAKSGSIRSAGWAGPSTIGITPVREFVSGPRSVEFVAAGKTLNAGQTIAELIDLAFTLDLDLQDRTFRNVAGVVGITPKAQGDSVKHIGAPGERSGEQKTFIARRFQGNRAPDIVMIHSDQEGLHLYLTSLDGTLRKAVFKDRRPPRVLAQADAKPRMMQEIDFWNRWLTAYNRRQAQAGKS